MKQIKVTTSNNQEVIINAFDELIKLKETADNKKLEWLIDEMTKLGCNDEQIKNLEERGLPKQIYVSSDIHKLANQTMSIYAEVTEHKLLPKGIMLFSWLGPFSKYNVELTLKQ
jgi:hypothetical protein